MKKIQDRDILEIYYFSNYNNNIENSLLDLGLISTKHEFMPIARKLILYDSYIYIVLIILMIFTLKISYTHSKSKKYDRKLFFKQG